MNHQQPRELAELKGADKKNPKRYRNNPPKSKGPLGLAPEGLGDDAKKCWFEISTFAIPGVLTEADRYILEVASNLLAEYRDDPYGFAPTKIGHLRSALSEMGMTPSARAKLHVDKPKKEEAIFGTL